MSGSAHALQHANRQIDTANVYKNVGILMFTYAPNSLGLQEGYVADFCSGVLIHPRVFMTAAHCTAYGVSGVPSWIRVVVSFSHDNPLDQSTWVDVSRQLVYPTFPAQDCVVTGPYAPPPCPAGGFELPGLVDIGLVLLSRPVTGIAPATFATPDELATEAGARMTLVGYGCVEDREFVRNYGTSTLAYVSDTIAYYNRDSAAACSGDSGGPTLFDGRAVSVMSDGNASYSIRARADTGPVSTWVKGVIASVDLAVNLNQHGLTGSWYEPATSGQGFAVQVIPDQSPGNGLAFVSWFTFDTVSGGAERQRWYTLQGPVVTGQPSASLTIYQNTGGNFNAPPATNAQAVGTATLSFATCSSGSLSYTFTDGTGRTGTVPLTRLLPNVTCSVTTPYPTNTDFALSGSWYAGAATSGQGFTAEVAPNINAFFLSWFTYAPNGANAGAAGQRWYTAQGAFTPGLRTIPVQIYETTGGVFDTATPPGQSTVLVGTGTMAFQNCSAATLSYNFAGGSSMDSSATITLGRVGPVPPGCTQ